MPSAAYGIIRQAILDKDSITAMYEGHQRGAIPSLRAAKEPDTCERND